MSFKTEFCHDFRKLLVPREHSTTSTLFGAVFPALRLPSEGLSLSNVHGRHHQQLLWPGGEQPNIRLAGVIQPHSLPASGCSNG